MQSFSLSSTKTTLSWSLCYLIMCQREGPRNISKAKCLFFVIYTCRHVIWSLKKVCVSRIFHLLSKNVFANAGILLLHESLLKRARKNALDLFGHFLHFIGEIFMLVLWVVANITSNGTYNSYAIVAYVYESGLLSILLIIISPVLKHEFKEMFLKNSQRISILWMSYVTATFAILLRSFSS